MDKERLSDTSSPQALDPGLAPTPAAGPAARSSDCELEGGGKTLERPHRKPIPSYFFCARRFRAGGVLPSVGGEVR